MLSAVVDASVLIAALLDSGDNVISYDDWYVALAEALQLPLATSDETWRRRRHCRSYCASRR